MKVQLWAKKLGGNGHVFLNVVDIPEGKLEWHVPVRQPLKVVSSLEVEAFTVGAMDAVRTFRYQYNAVGRIFDDMPRFLEV